MHTDAPYQPNNTIRIVTAASLFDGHDAAINVMRRIIQGTGCEVIHLGHNRSVEEVVSCAIQEDAQAIAMTSYQGGHVEYFKYMFDMLKQRDAGHIKVFGGGGGTILPAEIEELHHYGIAKIYSPDDGRSMGLQGMINHLVQQSDFATPLNVQEVCAKLTDKDPRILAQAVSAAEQANPELLSFVAHAPKAPVLGITGTGGAGKSSLTDELIRRFLLDHPTKTIAIVSVDPSKRKTGGALLGDRIRMNAVHNPRVYMRSFATREANVAVNAHLGNAVQVLSAAGFDVIIVETAGIGQSDSKITEIADVSMYVMTPEYGAASQLEKIDMIDYADIIALNKFDKRGAPDALRDVRKQMQRSRKQFSTPIDKMPVFGTIASQFNDPGTTTLYQAAMALMFPSTIDDERETQHSLPEQSEKITIIPPQRTRYLAEIVDDSKRYNETVEKQARLAEALWQLRGVQSLFSENDTSNPS
jgi:isobutyryl-CoA mutase